MASRNPNNLVRIGTTALPLAGLLALVGLYGTFKLGPGGILATSDNRAIVFASVLLGDVLALTVLIFGVVALYAYLAESAQRTLALGAMASSIVGISLTLSRLGAFAYAVPTLSGSFLEGNQESVRILDSIFAGPLGAVEIASVLHYSAASSSSPSPSGGWASCPGGLGSSWQPTPRRSPGRFGGGFGGGGAAGARGRRVDRPRRLARHPVQDGALIPRHR
jgi:hypothetical protein